MTDKMQAWRLGFFACVVGLAVGAAIGSRGNHVALAPLAVNRVGIDSDYAIGIYSESNPDTLRICQNVDHQGSVWWAPRADGLCYGADQPRR